MENVEQIEIKQHGEKIPYDPIRVQRQIEAINKAEMKAERWKRPGQELLPSDQEVIGKFGYKSWQEVPVGQ